MGKKLPADSRLKSSTIKQESQEKKARKKLPKKSKNDHVNEVLNRSTTINRGDNHTELLEAGKLIEFEGVKPTPRSGASFTLVPGGMAILFGGELYDGIQMSYYDETFFYNFEYNEWRLLQTPVKPLPRCSHQAAFFDNRLYIFGGEYSTADKFHHFDDMYSLCMESLLWTKVKATGDIPTARSGHRMTLWNELWVLFGGFHDTSNKSCYFNDLYIFSFKELRWKRILQNKFIDVVPDPRGGCLFAAQPNGRYILMYGGFTKVKDNNRNVSGIHHTDSWLINMEAAANDSQDILIWERANTYSKPPFSTGLGVGSYRNFAVVFGGVNDVEKDGLALQSIFYNSCYLLNIDQRRWHEVEINSEGRTDSDGVDDKLSESMKRVSIYGKVPPPRMNAYVIVDGNVLYVYGGIVEEKNMEITLCDMWSFDLNKRDGWKCIDCGFPSEDFWRGGMDTDSDEADDLCHDLSDDLSHDSSDVDSKSEKSTEECKDDESGVPKPNRGEKLASYFNRTLEFWIEAQGIQHYDWKEPIKDKKLKTDAFISCKNFYDEYKKKTELDGL